MSSFDTTDAIVGQIRDIFRKWGNADYIGEKVSQLSHAIQSANYARLNNYSKEMILGCLLHDIGHLVDKEYPSGNGSMNGLGVTAHEELGYIYLKSLGFPELVCQGSLLHVKAKRYMVSVNPNYELSEASKSTFTLQGGKLSLEEQRQFENETYFEEALKYRKADEAGKSIDVSETDLAKQLDEYLDMAKDILNERPKYTFEDGYLIIRDFYSKEEMNRIIKDSEKLIDAPETPGKWMKYYEKSNEELLARVEDYLDWFKYLDMLLNSHKVHNVVGDCMNEPVTLFKEKINFKYPTGGKFSAHQDEPAYSMFDHGYHITVCTPIDPMTTANGCLEIVEGSHKHGILPQKEDGTLTDEYEEQAEWIPVELKPGDILIFDSLLAHRSGVNNSNTARRAHYLTYNAVSKGGDVRRAYYDRKRKHFPPRVEKDQNANYEADHRYNLANPIKDTLETDNK